MHTSPAASPAPVAIYSDEEAHAIGRVIRSQIATGALMALGASRITAGNLPAGKYLLPGLRFTARILPYRTDGTRSQRPRLMTVDITLNGLDLYDIVVHYPTGLSRTIHHEQHDIDVESLTPALLALDSDHDRPAQQ